MTEAQDDRKRALWQTLLDKDDRTSPAEYPEMALITFEEFCDAFDVGADAERKRAEAAEARCAGLETALRATIGLIRAAHEYDGIAFDDIELTEDGTYKLSDAEAYLAASPAPSGGEEAVRDLIAAVRRWDAAHYGACTIPGEGSPSDNLHKALDRLDRSKTPPAPRETEETTG